MNPGLLKDGDTLILGFSSLSEFQNLARTEEKYRITKEGSFAVLRLASIPALLNLSILSLDQAQSQSLVPLRKKSSPRSSDTLSKSNPSKDASVGRTLRNLYPARREVFHAESPIL